MRTALVTGGAGFIGSHLCRHLRDEGYRTVAVDNLSGGWIENVPEGVYLETVELTDPAAVDAMWRLWSPDVVYHFAAYAPEALSHWMRSHNYRQNLLASIYLINTAINHGCGRFVFASSMAVYGEGEPPFDEEQTPVPVDPYGIAKYAVEMDLAAAAAIHHLDYTIIRPHNVYGPQQNLGDYYRNVVGIFIRQAMEKQPLTIFNNGRQIRSFTYIDDITGPIVTAASSDTGINQTFNLGSLATHSILDLAQAIEGEFGPQQVRFVGYRPEVERAYCDHSKATRLLNFHPTVTLEEGISRMAAWAVNHEVRCSTHPPVEVTSGLPHHWK